MRIIQISDLHLLEQPNAKVKGLDTEKTFHAVLDLIRQEEPIINAIILTGDLAEDASVSAYERISKKMQNFDCPIYWIPGNHDDASVMKKHFQCGNISSNRIIDIDGWRIILLDTAVTGKISGYLNEQELLYYGPYCQPQTTKSADQC